MFFQIGFAVFLILAAYVYLRIRMLLWSPRQRFIFTILYLLFAFSFLFTEPLAHVTGVSWSVPVLLAGYLTLPFMLYLFLSVLLFDVIRGINALIHAVPMDVFAEKKIRVMTLILIFLLPAIVVTAGTIHNSTIRMSPYEIQVPRRSSRSEQLKIVVASDFHLRDMTPDGLVPSFVDKVNTLDADFLLIPGDMVEGDRTDEQLERFSRELRRIRTRHGVFATLGNHDSHRTTARLDFYNDSQIEVLQDTARDIGGMCTLVGRKDGRSEDRRTIDDLMNDVSDTLPVIVLDHRPTDYRSISAAGADIVVSGHTHYGQLWPINYIISRLYDLDWGYRKFGDTHAFVTSGVQVWGPPVRTAGNSEIMLVTVGLR